MNKIKKIVKKIPVIPYLYRNFRDYKLRKKETEEIFLDIYKNNKWEGKDSISGKGSDTQQTKFIAKELPVLFSNFDILTILDIPCGDFYWMKNVDLSHVNYIGADIVNELVEKNSEQYERNNLSFQKLDLITDKLPEVDLIFCRDCLVHLSFDNIFLALKNICDSQSKYLLTTTFTERRTNQDIATGNWRTLNLELPPFTLSKPAKIINEECTEDGDLYADKALGLWRIADIQKALSKY